MTQSERDKIAEEIGKTINPFLDKINKKPDRFCPTCGRAIPFDARICPYCKRKFEEF